ncbi:MAG: RDD family protein [Acidimicrobiia bacterium]
MKTERSRASTLQGQRAGFVSRVTAAAIDVGIVFSAFFAALAGFAVVRYLLTNDPLDLPDPGAVWSGVGMFVILVLVLTVAWAGSGRTLGDTAVGLRVVTESGEELRWRRALVRALVVVFLPVISMAWILLSRKNAGLHDLACRTTVIYDWRARSIDSRPRE